MTRFLVLFASASILQLSSCAVTPFDDPITGLWGGDHITIDGNVVEHACTDIGQECLTLASTDVFEIKNNEVFDCQEEGIDVKDDASNGQVYRNHVHDVGAIGIYIDAWDRHTHDIAVFQNRIHHVSEYNGIALASEMGGLLENIAIYTRSG